MIGRFFHAVVSLVLYFSLATLIAEAIMAGYISKTWQLDQEKITGMLAIARGVDLAGPKAATQRNEPADEQVSYDQILETRAIKDKNLQLRELALANALSQLRIDSRKLTEEEGLYKQRRAGFEKELAALREGATAAGRDEVRRILQSLKPKQTKEILLQMLDNKEINEVVILLAGMPDTKRAKILSEFKTPEETKQIEEVLRLIRQGAPEATTAEKAQDQLQQPQPAAP